MTRRTRLFLAGALAATFACATAIASAQEHGEHAATGEHAAGGGHPAGEHGAGAAHGEAHAGEHHAPLNFSEINWTDVFDRKHPAILSLVINFALLAGLYYTLGKKPIAEALKQRRTTIGKDIEDARKQLAEAQARAKKYQADLGNAETDAETARATLVAAGKGEAERLVREAHEKAERMKRDADHLVVQEQKQVREDLYRETIDLAVGEAGRLLERAATSADHARLADDLLAELARRPSARQGAA